MKKDYISKCLNGTLQVGNYVMNVPPHDYPIMHGIVTEIYHANSKETLGEIEKPGDCIHVKFLTKDYSPERIKEIECDFSEKYNENKEIGDINLDDVIIAQDSLIRLDDTSDYMFHLIGASELGAKNTALCILSDYIALHELPSSQNLYKFMLISARDNDISTAYFSSYINAYDAMEKAHNEVAGADEEHSIHSGGAWATCGYVSFEWIIEDLSNSCAQNSHTS